MDTSVLIVHLRGKTDGKHLMSWAGTAGTPYVSVVSILEIAQGMLPEEEKLTQSLLDCLDAVNVTPGLSWEAGALIRSLRRQGLTIHLPDALIGVSALSVEAALLTHNARHFEAIPGLEVLDASKVSNP